MPNVRGRWKQAGVAGGSGTILLASIFDLSPRSVGGAKPNALVRILRKAGTRRQRCRRMRPIRTSFAMSYPVRRRTTGSIHRKAVADISAAAFRFLRIVRAVLAGSRRGVNEDRLPGPAHAISIRRRAAAAVDAFPVSSCSCA